MNGNHIKGKWATGDKLAISTSQVDTETEFTSLATISRLSLSSDGKSTNIFLTSALSNEHTVRRVKLTNGSGKIAVLAPVVSKINRNIVITGMPIESDLKKWYDDGSSDDGGHISIANTIEKVTIRGVEISAMGQPGVMGRYPLHAHFLGDFSKTKSTFKDNSIHHSKQRCVVIHATSKMKIDSNVAFRGTGHCFVTEDGLEEGNTFKKNVVIGIRRAQPLIKITSTREATDFTATGFWMVSPNNNLVKNIVGGAANGIWYESTRDISGQSVVAELPGWKEADTSNMRFGKSKNNEIFCTRSALATYGQGINHESRKAYFDKFFIWTTFRG